MISHLLSVIRGISQVADSGFYIFYQLLWNVSKFDLSFPNNILLIKEVYHTGLFTTFLIIQQQYNYVTIYNLQII